MLGAFWTQGHNSQGKGFCYLEDSLDFLSEMAPRKGKEKKEEQVISLGPQVAEGENVFGVCHIFASFNDTFVHATDVSGKDTICHVTGCY